MPLQVKLLTPISKTPSRATEGSAGYDLFANEEVLIEPRQDALVGTGVAIAMDPWLCGQIWPRSGLDSKHRITRGAGLIDSDYRGEVKVLLVNRGDQPFQVNIGDRIAQIVFVVIATPHTIIVDGLPTPRSLHDGFGSTGHAEIAEELKSVSLVNAYDEIHRMTGEVFHDDSFLEFCRRHGVACSGVTDTTFIPRPQYRGSWFTLEPGRGWVVRSLGLAGLIKLVKKDQRADEEGDPAEENELTGPRL